MKKTPIFLIVIGILISVNVFTITKLFGKSCLGYSYINYRFSCGHKNIVNKKEYSELRSKINSFIESKKNEGRISMAAVWFRDLEGGPTFGIKEREDFIPASLLKLPLVLLFFELAENNPIILEQATGYKDTTSPVPSQLFLPAGPIEKNRQYTIEELIKHAIIYSDNLASQLLFDYLNTFYKDHPLSETYRNLGILDPGENFDMTAVNAKEYSSIFRQLYNTSFLNNDYSEKLLSLLAQSDFKNGLRLGIPDNVVVAHKFGERSLDHEEKQLHDCGIIYYPGNPYQICIMTRGKNFNDLSVIIGEISKQVYEEFDSRNLSR